jgi:hypothetical protein
VRQVDVGDRVTGAVAVEARPLLVLELEQLEQTSLIARRRHHLQVAALIGEQDPRRADVEHRDAPVGQRRQEVDDVEVVDQRVSQLHERLRQQGLVRARDLPGLDPIVAGYGHPTSGPATVELPELVPVSLAAAPFQLGG